MGFSHGSISHSQRSKGGSSAPQLKRVKELILDATEITVENRSINRFRRVIGLNRSLMLGYDEIKIRIQTDSCVTETTFDFDLWDNLVESNEDAGPSNLQRAIACGNAFYGASRNVNVRFGKQTNANKTFLIAVGVAMTLSVSAYGINYNVVEVASDE